jgi:hypothetical protein
MKHHKDGHGGYFKVRDGSVRVIYGPEDPTESFVDVIVELNEREIGRLDDSVAGPETAREEAAKLQAVWGAGRSKERELRFKALGLIEQLGGIDGGHHKAWVIDQVVRILTGKNYAAWVAEYKRGEDGPETYDWDEGIAP